MSTRCLKALGVSAKRNKKSYSFSSVNARLLERFQAPDGNQVIELICDEFTSLCPVTGQPDFARLRVFYQPKKWCVESKSVKLYLMGFRQSGAFAETVVSRICDDLQGLLSAKWIRVAGKFASRGGVGIVTVSMRFSDEK